MFWKKKHKSSMMGMMAGGLALAEGAHLATEAGSPEVAQGFSRASKAYPKVGGLLGASMVMDQLDEFSRVVPKKRKY